MSEISRRTLLKASPLAGLASVLPAAAGAGDSEIVRSYRVWKDWVDWYDSPHDFSDAECDRLSALRYAEEDRIFAIPARDARDVLAKIMIASLEGEVDFSEADAASEILAEARAML